MVNLPIYLDYNATTPADPRVVDAMLPFFNIHFGNAASRNHSFGWQAEEAVDMARQKVASLIGASPAEIVFTSGATEADNLAIKGIAGMYAPKGRHIITVQTEHKAVLDSCHHLEREGAEVTFLPVNSEGVIDLNELESTIRTDTVLIAIMYANNETGVIQPVKQIGDIAKRKNVLFFTDATQAVGKIPLNVVEDGIDVLALSAHKFYGPKGVGALYIRRRNPRVKLVAQMDGGGHEKGVRSGTLNVPAIVGLGKACEIAMQEAVQDGERLAALRNKLEQAILKEDDTYVNGNTNRLPHVSNISFRYVDGQALIGGLNKSMAVSSGSACMSASMEPSYVLKAMGVDDELAYGSIRFSLGKYTTEEEIDFTVAEVRNVVQRLRQLHANLK